MLPVTPYRLARAMVRIHGFDEAIALLLKLIDKCDARAFFDTMRFYVKTQIICRQLKFLHAQ